MKEKVYLEVNRHTGSIRVIGDFFHLRYLLENFLEEDTVDVLKEIIEKGFYTGKHCWIREKEDNDDLDDSVVINFESKIIKGEKKENVLT